MSAAAQATRYIRFSIQYSSIALLYYDYALTWTREVKHFWTKRISFSTILYIACRYALVANVIYTLALAEKLPTVSCDGGYQVCSTLSLIGRMAMIIVWGARTYAVWNRNKWVLALLASLGTFTIILATLHIPYVACHNPKKRPKILDSLGIMTVTYELVAVILTTFRTYQSLKYIGPIKKQRDSLSYLILQQGLLYYFFVTAFTVTAVVLQFTIPSASFFQRLLNALTIPISGMMTARFLLHLRDWGSRNSDADTFNPMPGGDIQFHKSDKTTNQVTGWSVANEFGVDPVREAERTQLKTLPS